MIGSVLSIKPSFHTNLTSKLTLGPKSCINYYFPAILVFHIVFQAQHCQETFNPHIRMCEVFSFLIELFLFGRKLSGSETCEQVCN